MAAQKIANPYRLSPENIEDPPRTFVAVLRRIGPGLILAGSIVGSGELIATTVLGAENGYLLLWLIIISCGIKTVVQEELGRYSIGTGETTLEAFDRCPGPRLKVSWLVWMWSIMVMFTLMQIGAMLGSIGEILNRSIPAIPLQAWPWLLAGLTAALLLAGRYSIVEKAAMIMVVSFTILTVLGAVILLKLPEYFSWGAIWEGLSFHLPAGGFLTAVAAFGITGVGATELVMYPYWCIEKGYASYTGPRDETPEWRSRAHGWIRVMGVDVVNAMVVYTFATIAFYLLGAGVLHGRGVTPQGSRMVQELSALYTETLGAWSLPLFLAGAFAVLYSTVFSSTAAHCRVFADFTGMLGLYDRTDYEKRLKVTRIFVLVLLVIPCLYFMAFGEPVAMVKVGGFAQATMLPVIGFYALYLRYKRMPARVLPKGWITLGLWVSAVMMATMMGYSVLQESMRFLSSLV
jgi:Mn2+/Fe2+ NRAMP family transporter